LWDAPSKPCIESVLDQVGRNRFGGNENRTFFILVETILGGNENQVFG